ncbi:MAG TPA: TonB-dependent receptor, partial [Flavobacteriaceae bacterium]|nr:TonB-dependent receptor [Flavobacteriaceae bacterium]
MKKYIIVLFLCIFTQSVLAQNVGKIEGRVIDAQTREPIEFANVIVTNQQVGAITKENGEFVINNVPLGYVKLTISILGYTTKLTSSYYVTKEIIPFVEVALEASNEELEEVVITRRTIRKSLENPLSTQVLGITEIEKNPGGNRDVLKVLQSLPGVATNPGFRNDVIIRGGAPFESKFYLDGIEVPVINHFQTQGATGGPVGIINADLIREVNFSTSAFLASQGNALSAITNFTQKTGNKDHVNARLTLGTSDAGITLDGPISKNATFIASFRQSYLKFIFEVLKLPFLPTYNDFQLNTKFKLSEKDELSIIALGAIDNFKLNTGVNKNVTDEDDIKRNEYIIANIPISEQWNYTVGASYKHYSKNSFQNIIISRNEWKNEAIKYFNNTNNPSDLLIDYDSKEIENKFRFENVFSLKNEYKLKAGFNFDNVNYTNATFQKIATSNGNFENIYNTNLDLNKYGIYSQLSKRFNKIGLGISAGFRFDAANYSDEL